jgi:IMP dehydrogenase
MSKTFYKSLGEKEIWPNITGVNPSSLTYDDVLLVPQNSDIISREVVDTSVKFGPYKLSKPIITAPVDTIVGEKMIREFARLGALGILPRGDINERVEICERFSKEGIPSVYDVGLKNGLEEAKLLKDKGAKAILVDVANGGMRRTKELARDIKRKLGLWVIAGNIVTYEQANDYKNYGIDVARVGVGPGGLCITRLVAGAGFPQLSAIFETTAANLPVIADGGIRKPADFVKAIAAGATLVMCASIFAGTDETPGKVINGHKIARGQASESYMKDNGIETGEFRAAEGISIRVKQKGPVKNIIEEFMGGLRSAMTYAGTNNLKEFREKAVFCKISESTLSENEPWLIKYRDNAF